MVKRGHTQALRKPIDIFVSSTLICFFVMRDVVDLVLLNERGVDNPWRVFDNFVHPTTVANSFQTVFKDRGELRNHIEKSNRKNADAPFCVIHHSTRFVLVDLLV